MNYENIKHIIFDLDNTLWDFSGNSKKILAEIFAEFDISNGKNIDFEKFHEQYKFRNEFLWREYAFGNVSRDEVRFNRFFSTFNDFGISDYELASKAADYYILHTRKQKELLPGAIETLDYLSGKYELHIITNGFEEVQFFKLKNCGIDNYFKTVTTAEAANALKPDRKIFDYALKRIKAEPLHCIYIGDSSDVDGQGAKNAGMDFILFDNNGKQEINGYTKINSLVELTQLL